MELMAEKYKQSEVGLIPSDWEVMPLVEIGDIATGTTPPTNNKNNYGEDYFFVSPADLGKGKYIVDTEKKLSKLGFSITRKYPSNSILFTCIGSTIGKSGISKVELSSNQQINAVFPNDLYSTDFLFYYLNFISPKIKLGASEQAVPMINKTEFGKTLIACPTKAEQTAIATALSDADALISSLEKLIAKKRNIKQGAMQKLLQPKEGWEVKPFKDLCWFQEGPGLRNWQFTTRGIKVINVTNLENGILNLDRTERHISLEEFHKMYEHFEIDENDIVVASSGNSYGKVAVVRKQDLPLVMNTSVIRFKPFKELDYNFLLTFLKSNQFKKQIDLLITGGAQPNFGPVHLNKISINVPPTKEEQTRIATVLLDMDNEMLALETKLEKYKKVKLGMMQNLLTGKIRLI